MNSKLYTWGIVLVLLMSMVSGCGTAALESAAQPVSPTSPVTKEILTQTPEPAPTQTQAVDEMRLSDTANDDFAIREALATHLGANMNDLTIVINENTGTHARGGVENGYFLAAKVDGQWRIVADGQGALDCQALAQYSFTPSMLPECPSATSDEDAIRAALAAHLGANVNDLTIVINENTGTHARGGVENGYFLAAKVDGQWRIVADGQGALDCQALAQYGFPPSMLPECPSATSDEDAIREALAAHVATAVATPTPVIVPTQTAVPTPTPEPTHTPTPMTRVESISGSIVLYVQGGSLRSSPHRSLFEHPEMQRIYPWDDISSLNMYLIGHSPVPSPDGRWLVIIDPLPSGPDIQPGTTWLGDLLTGELTKLGRPALAPTWSPDGHRITYVLDETLYVWDVAGDNEPVAVFRQEGLRHLYARWSPTGEWIAVADDAKTEDRTSPIGMWTYWLVSPDGSEIKELGSWPTGGMGVVPQNLDWSPDGKLLLALPSVVVLTLEGQSIELSEVYESPPDSVPTHLLRLLVGEDKMLDKKRAWLSHGGQQIAYLGHDGIYVFDRESQTDSLIATYDVVGQMVCRSCLQVRWSADDSLLIAGTRDTAGSRKDMCWGRILALKPEAGSVPELLVEGEDVYLVDVVPDIGGRETSKRAVIDCHSYAGWARYENGDYGFTFRYPATWTLREETGFVSLGQGPMRLAIAFRRQGEDFTGYWTGMPAGDLEDRGIVPALGLEIAKQALVHEGKVKVLVYSGEAGDLVFSIRVESRHYDLATMDYQAIEIPETVEDQVDQILGSFEMR